MIKCYRLKSIFVYVRYDMIIIFVFMYFQLFSCYTRSVTYLGFIFRWEWYFQSGKYQIAKHDVVDNCVEWIQFYCQILFILCLNYFAVICIYRLKQAIVRLHAMRIKSLQNHYIIIGIHIRCNIFSGPGLKGGVDPDLFMG